MIDLERVLIFNRSPHDMNAVWSSLIRGVWDDVDPHLSSIACLVRMLVEIFHLIVSDDLSCGRV